MNPTRFHSSFQRLHAGNELAQFESEEILREVWSIVGALIIGLPENISQGG